MNASGHAGCCCRCCRCCCCLCFHPWFLRFCFCVVCLFPSVVSAFLLLCCLFVSVRGFCVSLFVVVVRCFFGKPCISYGCSFVVVSVVRCFFVVVAVSVSGFCVSAFCVVCMFPSVVSAFLCLCCCLFVSVRGFCVSVFVLFVCSRPWFLRFSVCRDEPREDSKHNIVKQPCCKLRFPNQWHAAHHQTHVVQHSCIHSIALCTQYCRDQ